MNLRENKEVHGSCGGGSMGPSRERCRWDSKPLQILKQEAESGQEVDLGRLYNLKAHPQ